MDGRGDGRRLRPLGLYLAPFFSLNAERLLLGLHRFLLVAARVIEVPKRLDLPVLDFNHAADVRRHQVAAVGIPVVVDALGQHHRSAPRG